MGESLLPCTLLVPLLMLLALNCETTNVASANATLPKEEVEAINALARISMRIYGTTFSESDCGVALQNEVVCNCSGTTCSVTKFYFSSLGMRGAIPEEIGNLSHLTHLDLRHNRLRNEIPDSLRKLRNLSAIYLDDNKLEGNVTTVFGQMQSLNYLGLSNNFFHGAIPPELGDLPLRHLHLDHNLLSEMPPELGNISTLERLDLSDNQLSGEVPPRFGGLKNLKVMDLSDNLFSGELPSALGNLSNLQYWFLANNNFSGKLPQDFKKLGNMSYFDVRGNNFDGSIPEFISSWHRIVGLWLLGNNFEGPSSDSFQVFQSLEDLRFLHLTGLRGVNGREQGLPFPKVNKNLTSLTLRNCSIVGEIPDFIWQNQFLLYLDLSFNNLTGEIPPFANGVLHYLYLGGNNLNGTMRGWFTNLTNSFVDVSENNITSLDLPDKIPENWNLFACCSSNINNGYECQKANYRCNNSRMNHLFINCGGNFQKIDGNDYEDDSKVSGKSTFFLSKDGRWGFSSMGSWGHSGVGTGGFISLLKPYPDHYVFNSTCGDSENIAKPSLFSTARIAPISLKYYGFCLKNGNYTVKLDFAEILCQAKKEAASVQMRIFDVDIQGKNVLRNFKIQNESEAGGNISKEFNVTVNDNPLEIHLYWAGKGSVNRQFMYNGPLISAISVFPVSNFAAPEKGNNDPSPWATFGIVASASLVPASILVYLWKMGLFSGPPSITYFDPQAIEAATANFSSENKLAEGEFASVYKGDFGNGTERAVKKLSRQSIGSMSKLIGGGKVLETLCKLQHPNLARLLGCCKEEDGEIQVLVSELPEDNISLEASFDNPENQELRKRLDWLARVKICYGLAKGLAFLHGNSKRKIAHKYLKPANILLDKVNLIARISDFEFATLFEGEMSLEDTKVEGKMSLEEDTKVEGEMSLEEAKATNIENKIDVYMAPECATGGKITDKADVYSFGVVTLEIISGKKAASDQPNDKKVPDLARDQPNDENVPELASNQPNDENVPELTSDQPNYDQPNDENVQELASNQLNDESDQPNGDNVPELTSDQPNDENVQELANDQPNDQPNDENIQELVSDQPNDENVQELASDQPNDQPNDENIQELVSDQPNDENVQEFACYQPNDDENVLYLSNIWQKHGRTQKREELLRLIDPGLALAPASVEEAITILKLAIECLKRSPQARPTMSTVVNTLERKIAGLSKRAQCCQAVGCCARMLPSIRSTFENTCTCE